MVVHGIGVPMCLRPPSLFLKGGGFMKYSDIIKPQMNPLGIREDDAGRLIGIPYLFTKMVRAGWIKPIVCRPKEKLFAVSDVELCFIRLRNGEHPQDA